FRYPPYRVSLAHAPPYISTLSLHDALPIWNAYVDPKLASLPKSLRDAADLLDRSKIARRALGDHVVDFYVHTARLEVQAFNDARSEEHTSELQSRVDLVCRLLLAQKNE